MFFESIIVLTINLCSWEQNNVSKVLRCRVRASLANGFAVDIEFSSRNVISLKGKSAKFLQFSMCCYLLMFYFNTYWENVQYLIPTDNINE